jgi:hypothetical protein
MKAEEWQEGMNCSVAQKAANSMNVLNCVQEAHGNCHPRHTKQKQAHQTHQTEQAEGNYSTDKGAEQGTADGVAQRKNVFFSPVGGIGPPLNNQERLA